MEKKQVKIIVQDVYDSVSKVNEETLLRAFSKVKVSGGGIKVIITQSDKFSAKVNGGEKALECVKVYTHGSTLYIERSDNNNTINISGNNVNTAKKGGIFTKLFNRMFGSSSVTMIQSGGNNCTQTQIIDGNVIRTSGHGNTIIVNGKVITSPSSSECGEITVYVNIPELTSIVLNGSATVNIDDMNNENFGLLATIAGSGDINMGNVSTEHGNIEFSINGSGDITANKIETTHFHALIRGSGDITVKDLFAISVDNAVEGSGDINYNVLAAKDVSNTVHGSGDIDIRKRKRL
jgi:hypothetical protein